MPKAVATSTARDAASFILKKAGLFGRFQAVVTGDQVARSKPAPDIFLEAARLLGAQPENCLVLEDSGAGICAAAAAGMIPIMVPDLIAPTEEIRRLARGIFDSLNDVLLYLKNNRGNI